MYIFWLTCSYFIGISAQTHQYQKLNFSVMPLGHSGLLIYWDRGNVEEERDTFFRFFCQRIVEGIQYSLAENVNNLTFFFGEKQYKVDSLNESTHYQINIKEEFINNTLLYEYSISGKTNAKTNLKPKKPDFNLSEREITWLPCGRLRNCTGDTEEEAGTHFSVRYKILESKQWHKYDVRIFSYTNILLFASKIYEIKVASVNGNSETDSDIQEVFLRPVSSPVQSVKIMALSNSSALISWKPPAHSLYPIDNYIIYIHKTNSCDVKYCNLKLFAGGPTEDELYYGFRFTEWNEDDYELIKITRLIPDTHYMIFIVPIVLLKEENPGYEYSFNYTHQNSHEVHLPLAKPDFRYTINHIRNSSNISVIIQWLPCGLTFNCKDTKPGSYFSVQIKCHNRVDGHLQSFTDNYTETDSDIYSENFYKTDAIEITVLSVDGPEISKSDTKIICAKMGFSLIQEHQLPHCLQAGVIPVPDSLDGPKGQCVQGCSDFEEL